MKVTLIDRNDYFEYICTNPRSLVKESYINEITILYNEIGVANPGKFDFIQGTLEVVNQDNSIDFKRFGSENLENISYDYLVICTGSCQNFPIKEAEGMTIEDRRAHIILER